MFAQRPKSQQQPETKVYYPVHENDLTYKILWEIIRSHVQVKKSARMICCGTKGLNTFRDHDLYILIAKLRTNINDPIIFEQLLAIPDEKSLAGIFGDINQKLRLVIIDFDLITLDEIKKIITIFLKHDLLMKYPHRIALQLQQPNSKNLHDKLKEFNVSIQQLFNEIELQLRASLPKPQSIASLPKPQSMASLPKPQSIASILKPQSMASLPKPLALSQPPAKTNTFYPIYEQDLTYRSLWEIVSYDKCNMDGSRSSWEIVSYNKCNMDGSAKKISHDENGEILFVARDLHLLIAELRTNTNASIVVEQLHAIPNEECLARLFGDIDQKLRRDKIDFNLVTLDMIKETITICLKKSPPIKSPSRIAFIFQLSNVSGFAGKLQQFNTSIDQLINQIEKQLALTNNTAVQTVNIQPQPVPSYTNTLSNDHPERQRPFTFVNECPHAFYESLCTFPIVGSYTQKRKSDHSSNTTTAPSKQRAVMVSRVTPGQTILSNVSSGEVPITQEFLNLNSEEGPITQEFLNLNSEGPMTEEMWNDLFKQFEQHTPTLLAPSSITTHVEVENTNDAASHLAHDNRDQSYPSSQVINNHYNPAAIPQHQADPQQGYPKSHSQEGHANTLTTKTSNEISTMKSTGTNQIVAFFFPKTVTQQNSIFTLSSPQTENNKHNDKDNERNTKNTLREKPSSNTQ